jgi:glycyl-tRNA synthetase alpha chain
MKKFKTFQQIIASLNEYWASHGCAILQPYDTEVGAGTLSPFTTFGVLGKKNWNVAYVQGSRRPKDGRYGENPNRLQHYYQYQVILKPSPDKVQELCIKSLESIGINAEQHDIRFVEDDWENPTIGAWGLGWEVWCDGMEVLQFTYMQQIGGIECDPIPAEITYGLERLAMYVQNVEHFKDIVWTIDPSGREIKYGELFLASESQFSSYHLEHANVESLLGQFGMAEKESYSLLDAKLPLPAYHQCLKASHYFNMLDARGAISVTERASYIAKVRNLAKLCCSLYMELYEVRT